VGFPFCRTTRERRRDVRAGDALDANLIAPLDA
jgi:hypothetical protein